MRWSNVFGNNMNYFTFPKKKKNMNYFMEKKNGKESCTHFY